MFKNVFGFYGYFLYGTNRCAEILMCFAFAFYNKNNKNVWPAQVPITWRGGVQACLLGYAAPGLKPALGVLNYLPNKS